MAQRENLEVQGRTSTDQLAERRQKSHQDRRHSEPSLSFAAGKFNHVSAYDVFGRHSRLDLWNERRRRGEFHPPCA
jgi:hypothetical protein